MLQNSHSNRPVRPLRIFTWHIHGNYLYYLVHTPHEFFVPVKPGRPDRYAGTADGFDWPQNIHEVPAERVSELEFDCILFQADENYLEDQFEILSAEQRALPRIYLEHDPPRENPTNTRHLVDDPSMLLVHVTHFNDLMWDSGVTPTRVVEHGIPEFQDVKYTGEIERGLVIINNLQRRGRRLGLDIFERVRKEVPLDLIGMNSEIVGGLGAVSHQDLPSFEARYRFIFNPIRYTSLGLAVCEAMMIGMPIIGLATTEMVTAIENGVSGYVDTDVNKLIIYMKELLADPKEARRLGQGARTKAQEKFNIRRFASDWNEAFALVTQKIPESTLAVS